MDENRKAPEPGVGLRELEQAHARNMARDQADMSCNAAEDRDQRDARYAIQTIVKRRQEEWTIATARMLNRAAIFCNALGWALGQISRDERTSTIRKGRTGAQEVLALTEHGFLVRQLAPHVFPVDGKLDLYPTHRRYHNLRTGQRGTYRTALGLARCAPRPIETTR